MPTSPSYGAMPIARNDSFKKQFQADSPLKKLIKIFRGGNVIRHHFQSSGGSRPSPVGTAKAFFRNTYNFQSSVIPGYSGYDRFARYSDYAEMESYPILAQALNIIADEVVQKNEKGKIIEVISENSEIQQVLQELIDVVLNLNGQGIFKLVRNLLKYGDAFYLIDATEKNGIVNLIQMPANEVEREEGFDPDDLGAIRFRWTSKANIEIPNAYVVHFRLDGNDLFYPYGTSILEAARRPWRQLVLLEDAMMIYRLTRAPERRVFFLDIMGADPADVETIVNKFNQSIKKHKVTNDKGQIDLRYASTMSLEEDYIIPVRGGDTGTRIETLPGGQNIGDMEDIEFIKKNLFSSLGIPKAFLTFDEDVSSKQTLTQEDIRFARTVAKIQEIIINELVKISMIHLYIRGLRGKDLVNFRIKMTNPSTVAELQKNELWRARMDLVHSAGDGVFDTTFIYKNFLHLADDTIDKIRKGQILDKLFQAKLIQLENSSGMMPGGMGLGGGLGGLGGMGGGTFGGGMGGDLGLGMPPAPGMGATDLGMQGGTPELGTVPPGTMGEATDLTRTSDERFATARGVDQIPGVGEENYDQDPYDTSGIRRTYKRPAGAREEKMNIQKVLEEFNEILREYRKNTVTVTPDLLREIVCKENGIFIGEIEAKASTFKERYLAEVFGGFDESKNTKSLLTEAAKQQLKEDSELDSWGEESLAKLDEKCNLIINQVFSDKNK